MDQNIDELISMISGQSWLVGDLSPEEVADEWIDEGISVPDALAYIEVGCWDPHRVAALIAAGIEPDHLEDPEVIEQLPEYQGRHLSVGYYHSNGDITTRSIAKAIQLCGSERVAA